MESADIAVVGGGIAGVSVGYFLSLHESAPRVVVCEAESTLTHHTTGRSAAVFIENYGAAPIRPLTMAGKDFFLEPPPGLVDGPLLHKKGYLGVAEPEDVDQLAALAAAGQATTPDVALVSPQEACRLAPHLRPELVGGAVYEPGASGIDVAGLHQAFVRGLAKAGGTIALTRRVDSAKRSGGSWQIETTQGPLAAGIVVNASGAWGDQVAESAGVEAVGLRPKRRTAFMVNSRFPDSAGWPLVASYRHDWYTNPDGTQFLCSPADETDSEPCDAKPEEIDIAMAIDRINRATTLDIRSITSAWAGLRTFSPDQSMVIGPDPGQPDFVWCVGQGGTGIQTAPGAGRLCADLCLEGAPSQAFEGFGLDLMGLAPDRFRS